MAILEAFDGVTYHEIGGTSDADAIHDNVSGEIAAVAEKVTPVNADVLLIEDSEASDEKKRVQIVNLIQVSATDKGLGRVSSGAGPVEEYDLTGAGRALLDDADAAAQRTTLGVVINNDQVEDLSLVLKLQFNNNVLDSSSKGNDATNNGATLDRGEAEFDGVDDFIDITAVLTNSLATTTKGTWIVSVKPVDATPAEIKLPISFGDTDADTFIHIRIKTDGKLRAKATKGGVAQWSLDTDAVVLSDNTRTRIALVQDGVSPVLYIDGVAVAQTFVTTTDKTAWFNNLTGLDNGRIGNRNVNSGGETNHFDGIEGNAQIYDRALSAAEIKSEFAATHPDAFLKNVVDDTTPQLGGELDAQAHTIGFTQQTATGDGTTTIDWKLGNKFKFTFGAFNETFTFIAPTKPCNLILMLVQDATGSRTATLPATVKYPGGTQPTLSTAANAIDIFAIYYDGTDYYLQAALDFS